MIWITCFFLLAVVFVVLYFNLFLFIFLLHKLAKPRVKIIPRLQLRVLWLYFFVHHLATLYIIKSQVKIQQPRWSVAINFIHFALPQGVGLTLILNFIKDVCWCNWCPFYAIIEKIIPRLSVNTYIWPVSTTNKTRFIYIYLLAIYTK